MDTNIDTHELLDLMTGEILAESDLSGCLHKLNELVLNGSYNLGELSIREVKKNIIPQNNKKIIEDIGLNAGDVTSCMVLLSINGTNKVIAEIRGYLTQNQSGDYYIRSRNGGSYASLEDVYGKVNTYYYNGHKSLTFILNSNQGE